MRQTSLQGNAQLNGSLRIALVHTADQGGGAEASTVSLKNALKALGHQCVLYVGTKQTDDRDIIELSRYRPFPGVLRVAKVLEDHLGWQYLYHPWFRRLDRLFTEPVDVVHYHSLWSGRLGYADVGGLPDLTSRYPSVMTLRDMWMLTGHCAYPAVGCERWKSGCGKCPDLSLAPAITHDGTRFNWERKRRAIQRSDLHVTAVSGWLAETAATCPIFAGKKIHTVHNGIDENAFHPMDRTQLRHELELPQDAFIVMVAGQSLEGTSASNSGARSFAVDAIRKSETSPYILAVGHSASSFLADTQCTGVSIPFQKDPKQLAKFYAASDVVLVASLWETFGRIPAEAQMCGVPVVGFATGGIPEIVTDDVTGILASTGDVDHLASGLRRLAANLEERESMGQEAYRSSRGKFSNLAIAQQYVDLYHTVIRSRAERAGACRAAEIVE
jgi:glycosyltransferase involved in cell wall biosynthesis